MVQQTTRYIVVRLDFKATKNDDVSEFIKNMNDIYYDDDEWFIYYPYYI